MEFDAKENIKHGYHIGIVEETHDEPNIAIDFTIEDGNIYDKFQIDRCKGKVPSVQWVGENLPGSPKGSLHHHNKHWLGSELYVPRGAI